jgi:hypothetical protein
MKTKIIFYAILLPGCSNSISSYPGSANSKPIVSESSTGECPDLAGTYDGVGVITQGDQIAMQFGRREYFDKVFPISDLAGWKDTQSKYRRFDSQKFKGLFVDPDFASVTNVGDGSVRISINYQDSLIGTFQSDYKSMSNFACSEGKIMWGGDGDIAGSSEWGKNSSSFSFAIYKDTDGNLIHERRQTVSSKLIFGLPGGTGNYYSIFKFKKKNN